MTIYIVIYFKKIFSQKNVESIPFLNSTPLRILPERNFHMNDHFYPIWCFSLPIIREEIAFTCKNMQITLRCAKKGLRNNNAFFSRAYNYLLCEPARKWKRKFLTHVQMWDPSHANFLFNFNPKFKKPYGM